MPLKGQMAFYGTKTDQALDLGRMQSLLGLSYVLEATNIHYAGLKLKRWCNLLICLGHRRDMVVDRHRLQLGCLVLNSLRKFKHPHFSCVKNGWGHPQA